MLTKFLIPLFEEGLDQLTKEINAYPKDEQLWKKTENIEHPGGNLCLHITGTLQHYVGAVLGDSGFVRNKDAEFRLKNVPKDKLLDDIKDTKAAVTDTLEQLSKNDLSKDYPLPVLDGEQPTNTSYYLLHLLNQLHFRIGQINYHRAIVSVDGN